MKPQIIVDTNVLVSFVTAARFADLGLTQKIPELRGEQARPADFES
jgi:hypothetical protein